MRMKGQLMKKKDQPKKIDRLKNWNKSKRLILPILVDRIINQQKKLPMIGRLITFSNNSRKGSRKTERRSYRPWKKEKTIKKNFRVYQRTKDEEFSQHAVFAKMNAWLQNQGRKNPMWSFHQAQETSENRVWITLQLKCPQNLKSRTQTSKQTISMCQDPKRFRTVAHRKKFVRTMDPGRSLSKTLETSARESWPGIPTDPMAITTRSREFAAPLQRKSSILPGGWIERVNRSD